MILPSSTCEVAVVGGGPAGMAAAVTAAEYCGHVVLLDAGHELGGQYWRHPPDPVLAAQVARHHHNLPMYRKLREAADRLVRAQRLTVLARHRVWMVGSTSSGFSVRAVDEGGVTECEVVLKATTLVLAPGAYDRQVPFPGWELPGVMTAGGLQATLKGSDVVVGAAILVAGSGPFLLSVGAGLAKAGGRVVGVHEASTARRWLPHLSAVASNPAKLREALGLMSTLVRHRVPYVQGSTVVAAHGTDRLQRVTVAKVDQRGQARPGSERDIQVDTLAVGWGFTPQLELPLALGCKTHVDYDGSLVVDADDQQCSSVPGVYVAGETCGVGGAELALAEGRIAGAAAAGAASSVVSQRVWRRRRQRLRNFGAAMHHAYPVLDGWIDRLTDDTIVCRCEEVTAGRLRGVAKDPLSASPRSVKLLTRVGMGLCQGRTCGFAASCLVARDGATRYEPNQMAERPISNPLRLKLLATDSDTSYS